MASIIKVIKGTTSVSLLDLSGFHLRDEGWSMNPAEREAGVVRDRVRCSLIAANKDDAASQFQTLHDLLVDATLYNDNDPVQTVPVYIETQHLNETNKRYALIAGDYVRFKRSPYHKVAQIDSSFEELDLVITREHPWRSHKPGILPGRIELDETDGPDYDPDETDFDVDLVSTFGQHPSITTGGVIGRPGRFGRGMQSMETTTNRSLNPSLGANAVNWVAVGTNTVARSTEQFKYGTHSLKVTYQDSAYLCYHSNVTFIVADCTVGVWIYVPTNYDGTDLQVYFTGFTGMTGAVIGYVNMTNRDQWQFVHAHGTPVIGDLIGHVRFQEGGGVPTVGRFIYIDAILPDARSYPVPFFDGSLGPGCAWTGAAHNSTSTLAASDLRYSLTASNAVSLGGWIEPVTLPSECTGNLHVVEWYHTSNDRILIYYNQATDKLACLFSVNNVDVNIEHADLTRYTWVSFAVTWDGATVRFYVNGSEVGNGALTETWGTAPPTLFVGERNDGTHQFDGVLDDIFILEDRAMSADEVSDWHDSGKHFVGDPNLQFRLPFGGPRQLHIANFRDDVEIDEIYNYEAGVGWSANFAASDEWELFPNPVSQNDFVLFGSTDQPFKHIVLNFRTAGEFTTTTMVLEYWNGAWVALTRGTEYSLYPDGDFEATLENVGNIVINFIPKADWVKADPGSGVAAWCVRVRETEAAPNYVTHPIHAGQLVYTARTNELRIPSTSLHGDAQPKALLRLHADGGGDADPSFSRLSRIVWGIKSKGLDGFTSNLNAGNQDNPAGWAVTYGADSSSSADPLGPGGYSAGITFAGDETLVVRVRIVGTNKLEYWLGNYRVFLICRQTGGAAGDLSVRLRTYLRGVNAFDPHIDSATYPLEGVGVGLEALDMGELNIPFGPYHSEDDFSNTDIIFHIFASRSAGASTLRIWALVLIPIDQASGTLNDTTGTVPGSGFALYESQLIDHDGGVIRRGTNKLWRPSVGVYHSVMSWDSGGAFVEINRLAVDSRIYFLLLHYPLGGSWGTGPMIASPGCHLVGELQLHHSYKLLRGND